MPIWGALLLALSVAAITQVGSFIVQQVRIKAGRRSNSVEEWHRNLRWAVELIATGDDRAIVLGVSALDALDDAKELIDSDQLLIDKVLGAIVELGVNRGN